MATTGLEARGQARRFLGPLLALLAGALVLLAAGVMVALLSTRQPQAAFAPNTPEGTVTAYLRLLQNGQVDQAFAMTDLEAGPPFFEPVTRERFHERFDAWSQSPHRVMLLHSTVSGDTASVTVDISTFRPDLFAAAEMTIRQTFTLRQRDGVWLITGPSYLR